jgi:hypothetical protein
VVVMKAFARQTPPYSVFQTDSTDHAEVVELQELLADMGCKYHGDCIVQGTTRLATPEAHWIVISRQHGTIGVVPDLQFHHTFRIAEEIPA